MDELRIIAENLADADRLLADGWKLRSAQLAELAEQLNKRLEGGEEAEQTLTSLYGEFDERLNDRAPIAESRELTRAVSLFTGLELCRSLAAKIAPERVPSYTKSQPSVAYFQNPYAGRILQCVTDLLPDAEATDAEDYTDACEGVAEGRYDFCLLPVESAGDGVMNRFARLIDRYDLFTVLICHLELSEEEYIRFALLSASPCKLAGADRMKLRIVPGDEGLWELLFVCQALGAILESCRSVPGNQIEAYQLTMQVQKADVAALTHYLELGKSRSTVTGYYCLQTLSAPAERELLY